MIKDLFMILLHERENLVLNEKLIIYNVVYWCKVKSHLYILV